MTDGDGGAFQADAFIEGFMRPRLEAVEDPWFGDRGAANSLETAAMFLEVGSTFDDAGVDIERLLLFEAIEWLNLGVDLGLLPDSIAVSRRLGASSWRRAVRMWTTLRPFIGPQLRAGVEIDPGTYWTTLVVSDSALTPAHRDFLSLMYCASDWEWERRMSDFGRVVAHVGDVGIQSVDPELVDQISWALSGAELESHRGDPAAWRAAWLRPVDNSGYLFPSPLSATRSRANDRVDAMTEARTTLLQLVTSELDPARERPSRFFRRRPPLQ